MQAGLASGCRCAGRPSRPQPSGPRTGSTSRQPRRRHAAPALNAEAGAGIVAGSRGSLHGHGAGPATGPTRGLPAQAPTGSRKARPACCGPRGLCGNAASLVDARASLANVRVQVGRQAGYPWDAHWETGLPWGHDSRARKQTRWYWVRIGRAGPTRSSGRGVCAGACGWVRGCVRASVSVCACVRVRMRVCVCVRLPAGITAALKATAV